MNTTRALGATGEMVGAIGFGAWAIGGGSYGAVERIDAERTVEAYLDAGGRFIDTARGYRESESILGEVLSRRGARDSVFLASKTGKTSSAEQLPLIREEAETSLRLLKTDVIDLYFIHAPPENRDLMLRVLDEFEALRREGKIRYIGASIKGPDVTRATVDLCRQYVDTGRIQAIQLIYSILRQMNRESIEYAQSHGVGIVARTALESGFLTGKYNAGHTFTDHRRRWSGRMSDLMQTVAGLGEWGIPDVYESLAQVALRFALLPEGVSTIIPGAKSAAQIESNMSVASLPDLPEALVARLVAEFDGFTEKANTLE